MTAVQPKPTSVGETFDSLSPATDEVVGTYPIHTAEDVKAAVGRARVAAEWWADLGFAGRAERLKSWKGVLTRRLPQLCQVVRDETGKPIADAQLESVLAIEHIAWAGKHAKKDPRRIACDNENEKDGIARSPHLPWSSYLW